MGRGGRRTRSPAWRLIIDSVRAHRAWVLVGVVLGLAWTAARVAVPLLVRGAVDHGIEADDGDALLRWTVAIALVGTVQAVATGFRRYAAFLVARRAETELRDRMFAHLQGLHFAYHDQAQTGQLMSRANTDLNQVQAFVVMIPLTLSNAAAVLAVVVVLVSINPLLTLLAVGTLPIVNVVAKRFGQRVHPEMVAIQAESAELASVVEETVSGVRVVKGFGAESIQRQRFGVEADDVYDASMRATMVRARYWPVLELLPMVGLITTLGYGGHQVLDGHMTIGTLVAFNVYVVMLIWPLRMLGMILAQAQRATASADRVHEVLAAEPVVVDPPHPVALPPRDEVRPAGAVRFEGVRFAYPGTAAPVLDGLDLDDRTGRVRRARRRHRVPASPPWPACSPASTTSTPGPSRSTASTCASSPCTTCAGPSASCSRRRSSSATRWPPTSPSPSRMPTWSASSGRPASPVPTTSSPSCPTATPPSSASGGSRSPAVSDSAVAIARAILADPRVLVLDDATSAVDPTKEHEIRDALAEVMQGRTTIVIAHRPATIALADRVVLLDGGRVVAEGTHAGLLASSERYREVLASAKSRPAVDADHEPVST